MAESGVSRIERQAGLGAHAIAAFPSSGRGFGDRLDVKCDRVGAAA